MSSMVVKNGARRITLVISVLFAVSFLATNLWSRKLMEGVSQDVGFQDVPFKQYKEDECRACHGASVAKEHHAVKLALDGQCATCHGPNAGQEGVKLSKGAVYVSRKSVTVMRNCLDCHQASPHHLTKAANENRCGECHDQGVSEFNVGLPDYEPSVVTPTVQSCRNCHTDSGKKYTKGKRQGEVINTTEVTHHATGIKRCDICHSENRSDSNVRICQKCHSREILHGIPQHVEIANCVGCHYKVGEQKQDAVPVSAQPSVNTPVVKSEVKPAAPAPAKPVAPAPIR